MRYLLMILGLLATAPLLAKGPPPAPKGNALLAKMAAEQLLVSVKDVRVLTSAAPMPEEAGGAMLVRADDGSDGGNPICYLMLLAGRPATPARIEATLKFQVCPRADQGKNTLLQRVNLGRRNAWLLRLEASRYDTLAKGGELQSYWAMATDMGDGAGLRPVFERQSTTFKSKEQAAVNQSEMCKEPKVQISAGEPQGLTILCDVEAMLGTQLKRTQTTFGYMWDGSQFAPK